MEGSSLVAGDVSAPVEPSESAQPDTSSRPLAQGDRAAAASTGPSEPSVTCNQGGVGDAAFAQGHTSDCLCFRSQDQFQCDPDSYNGAVRDNYSWSQDYVDVEVRVLVPKTVVKGRQVQPPTTAGLLSSE